MATTLSRAQLFAAAGRGGAALVLAGTGLCALADSAGATPPSWAIGPVPLGDLAYVRLLIGYELLAADFYTNAVGAGHLPRRAADDARLALANEQAHYTYLAGVLTHAGGTPLTSADIDFTYPAGSFYTARSIQRLGTTLEQLMLASCLGAAGGVTTPALASALAQIAANEAQHLSVLAGRVGEATYQDAFPATLDIAGASNALDAYTN